MLDFGRGQRMLTDPPCGRFVIDGSEAHDVVMMSAVTCVCERNARMFTSPRHGNFRSEVGKSGTPLRAGLALGIPTNISISWGSGDAAYGIGST